MEKSDQVNDLFGALSAAQEDIKPAVLDCENTHLRSKYASIDAIYAAIKAPLAKHGLSVLQLIENKTIVDESIPFLTTVLSHKSGQWISSSFELIVEKKSMNPMQLLGSALTYGKRYSLTALLGISDEEENAKKTRQDKADSVNLAKEKAESIRVATEKAAEKRGGVASVTEIVKEAAPYKPAKQYAPQTTNKNEADKMTEGLTDFVWESYVINFGKDQGKKLADLGKDEVKKKLKFFREEAKTPPEGKMLRFCDLAELYLSSNA